MAGRPVSLEGNARRAFGNVDTYGAAFPGASRIDLSIEGHVLDAQPGGDPRLGVDPAPAGKTKLQPGAVVLLLVALLVAWGG